VVRQECPTTAQQWQNQITLAHGGRVVMNRYFGERLKKPTCLPGFDAAAQTIFARFDTAGF
jgi:hypothetical protein